MLHDGVEKERMNSEERGEEGGRVGEETACPSPGASSAGAADGVAERGLSGASGGFSECGARGHGGNDQDGTGGATREKEQKSSKDRTEERAYKGSDVQWHIF